MPSPRLLPMAALVLTVSACSGGASSAPSGTPLQADGSPLRVLLEADPGPQGDDPPCDTFALAATCTRVGEVIWVLQADGGSWQLTSYTVDQERSRWVPGLQGSGGGLSPTVTEVDLSEADQPETLVVYGAGFDVVSSESGGVPAVVVHGAGQASVLDGAVVAGEREVRRGEQGWVSVPVG